MEKTPKPKNPWPVRTFLKDSKIPGPNGKNPETQKPLACAYFSKGLQNPWT